MVTSLFSQVLGTTEQPFWLPNLRIQLLSDQLALDHVDDSPLTCLRLDCNGSKSREGTYWQWIGCLAIKSDQKEAGLSEAKVSLAFVCCCCFLFVCMFVCLFVCYRAQGSKELPDSKRLL